MFDEPDAYVYPSTEGTVPIGINNNDLVSGYYYGKDGWHYGFIRDTNNSFTKVNCNLTVCNNQSGTTYVTGINSNGDVVGYCLSGPLLYHRGFKKLNTSTSYTSVDDPSVVRSQQYDGTSVNGINDSGQMTGLLYRDQSRCTWLLHKNRRDIRQC